MNWPIWSIFDCVAMRFMFQIYIKMLKNIKGISPWHKNYIFGLDDLDQPEHNV